MEVNTEIFKRLSERFSLIRLHGKDPSTAEGKNWQRWCSTRRPFEKIGFRPGENAGVACGPASGVIVLDIDHAERFECLCDSNGWTVPATFTVETGSGRLHHYYKYPANGHRYGCVSRKPDGFDVKGLGGQVVCPGSIHPDTGLPYEIERDVPISDAPEWLLELAIKEAESGEGEEIDLAALGVSERIRALITAPPDKGDRSEALMSVVNGLVAADVDSDTIYRVFEHFPIGAKYREKGTGRKAWLRAHIKKAKAFVKAGKPGSKPAPVGYTCAELMKMDFPPPKWTVENVLPEGLSLLCGKPKQGKSFLALNVGSAIGYGGRALGKIRVDQGKCLYLALEDGPRRLKSRLVDMLQDATPPEELHLFTTWPKADETGLDLLDKWLGDRAGTRLVVIDTLEKFRAKRKNKNVYAEDYEALTGLHALAIKHAVAVLVVHHLRKEDADDWLDQVSGSTGLTGCADTIMRLARPRGPKQVSAILNIVGRDIEETALALKFDPANKLWSLVGDADEVAKSKERQAVIDALARAGEPMHYKDVAVLLGKKPATLRWLMADMVTTKELIRVKEGIYQLPVTSNSTNTTNKQTGQTHQQSNSVGAVGACLFDPLTVKTRANTEETGSCWSVGAVGSNGQQTDKQADSGADPVGAASKQAPTREKFPNPLECARDKCIWLDWRDRKDIKEAQCVAAAMSANPVPSKWKSKRPTSRISSMSACAAVLHPGVKKRGFDDADAGK